MAAAGRQGAADAQRGARARAAGDARGARGAARAARAPSACRSSTPIATGKLVFEADGVAQVVRRDAGRARLLGAHHARRSDRPHRAERRRARRRCCGCCWASWRRTTARCGSGANVQVAYYDQQREQLDPERTVFDTIGDGNDTVTVNGQPRHVNGYLRDFLFPPERARSPVKALSGGERNRLLLARLFTRPANVLVLDEPTNDLDLETLELLEAQLVEWPGTLLLVSHDRAFLDNVVTSTLVFEGDGRVAEYVGGYEDWLRAKRAAAERRAAATRRRRRRTIGRGAQGRAAGRRAGAQAALLQGAAGVRPAAGAHRGARGRAARAAARGRRARVLQGGARRHQGDAGAAGGAASSSWSTPTRAGTNWIRGRRDERARMKARVVRLVVFVLPVLVYLLNFGLFQDPINKVIQRDDRNAGISVRAHWRWYVDPTVLVYDLREMPAGATGVDALRPFLHFAYKQKGRQFSRVDLAWRGNDAVLDQGERLRGAGAAVREPQPGGHDDRHARHRASARRVEGVSRPRRLVRRAELPAPRRLHDVREHLDERGDAPAGE